MTSTLNLHRLVEETYATIVTATMTADQLATLGYASVSAAESAIEAATVQLVVEATSQEITGDVAAAAVAGDLELTLTFAPSTSMTDTVQSHNYYVVFEPGSPTSERVLCKGRWVVSARPEAV